MSRAQILQQAGTAMLAKANQSGQTVMTLLR
ncbi:MAG: flagellin [Methylococcaceae bacterium]